MSEWVDGEKTQSCTKEVSTVALNDSKQAFPQLHWNCTAGKPLPHVAEGHLHGVSADMRTRVPGATPRSRLTTHEGKDSEVQRASPVGTSRGPRIATHLTALRTSSPEPYPSVQSLNPWQHLPRP